MIKYLLLGFVLMLSGLEVTAQSYCGDIGGDEWQKQEAAEGFQVFVHIEYANQFQVYTWYNDELIDVQPVPRCGEEENTEETTAQQELELMTFIHEARQRGVFDEVFGRGGE